MTAVTMHRSLGDEQMTKGEIACLIITGPLWLGFSAAMSVLMIKLVVAMWKST